MQLSPNLKFFLTFLLFFAFFISLFYIEPVLEQINIPYIGTLTLGRAVFFGGLILAFLFLFPLIIKGLTIYFATRAQEIFKIIPDKSNQGLHIFARHVLPGPAETAMSGLIRVMHYFVRFEDGKKFFHEIMSHSDDLVMGRPGYSGFESFETSVLKNKRLLNSLEKLSKKTKIQLALGNYKKPSNFEIIFPKKPLDLNRIESKPDRILIFFHSFNKNSFKISCVENKKTLWEFFQKNKLKAQQHDCFIMNNTLSFLNPFNGTFDKGFALYNINLANGNLNWEVNI